MTNLEKALLIRNNASEVLKSKKIETMLGEYGEVFYTGSYSLDLMTWNDIDMQLSVKEDLEPIDVLSNIVSQVTKDRDLIEARIINFKGDYKPKMPRGDYLGLKFNCPELGGIWKLDIWCLFKGDFEKNRLLIESLKSKLNKENRELILEIKNEMMSGNDRVPQMGSHLLYQAILLEGNDDKESVYGYLKENL